MGGDSGSQPPLKAQGYVEPYPEGVRHSRCRFTKRNSNLCTLKWRTLRAGTTLAQVGTALGPSSGSLPSRWSVMLGDAVVTVTRKI